MPARRTVGHQEQLGTYYDLQAIRPRFRFSPSVTRGSSPWRRGSIAAQTRGGAKWLREDIVDALWRGLGAVRLRYSRRNRREARRQVGNRPRIELGNDVCDPVGGPRGQKRPRDPIEFLPRRHLVERVGIKAMIVIASSVQDSPIAEFHVEQRAF